MPMYRTKPIEARRLDFDYPELVADIANWCDGKLFGKKLMVDWEGKGDLAYDGNYVAKAASGDFVIIDAPVLDALFEEVPPRA